MNGLMRGLGGGGAGAAGVAVTGCGNLGTLGNVLGGVLQPSAGSGRGAPRWRDGALHRHAAPDAPGHHPDGQTGNVYFDNRTQVVYQQQNYPSRPWSRATR